MSWDEQLFELFDDLEGQAEGLFAGERVAELADRALAEYAVVTLASRLMASVGEFVVLEVLGVGPLRGRLRRVCAEWCLLESEIRAAEWVVRLPAVARVAGASPRSVAEAAWSPVSRLGFGSALRRLAATQESCLMHTLDGTATEAVPLRVGADFVEVRQLAGATALVPFTALAAVSTRT